MRLTEKKENGFYEIKPDVGEEAKAQKWNYYDALNKLGQLEDIEEKLGVGLDIFVKALTDSFYVKIRFPSGIVRRQRFWGKYTFIDNIKGEWVFVYDDPYYVKLKEYGVTWALTKEELK